MPPGSSQLKSPLPPIAPKPPGGAAPGGAIKLPKKRITQRITVDPSKAAAAPAASPAPAEAGLRPAGPMPVPNLPTMKLSIPGPKASAQAAQQTQKVDTKSIALPLLVPAHIILNALPRDLLTCELSAVSQSPEAQREVPLPLSPILAMLPSGRIELPARDLIKPLPEGWTVPLDQVPEAYPISLPLAAIVPRIPPEMLAIRPDQKDIDPAIRNMSDPFTQEMIEKLQAQQAAQAAAATAEAAPAPEPEPTGLSSFTPPAPEPVAPPPAPEPEPQVPPEPEPVAITPEPEPEPEPAAPGSDFAASLRELALQANAAVGTDEPVETATDTTETDSIPTEPVTEEINLQPAPPPSEFGVKTIDSPPTQQIPIIGKTPAPEPSSSFTPPTEEPAEESEPEPDTSAAPEPSSFEPSAFSLPEEQPEPPTPEPEPEVESLPQTAEPQPAEATAILSELEPAEEPQAAEPEPEPEPVEPEPEPVAATPEPPPPAIVPPPPPPIAKPAVAKTAISALTTPATTEPPPPPAKIPPAIPTVVSTPPPPPPSAPHVHTSSIPVPVTGELGHAAKEIRIKLNTAEVEDLIKIPGVSARLARKILAWRELHGDFTEFSQLLSIPGMTKEIYRQFTGDPDSETALSGQVNVLLGAPLSEKLSLRDVSSHIRRWPSIQGCIIAGAEGLPIAKDVTDGDLAESISAFLPRIMSHVNETMEQIKAMPADEVHIVSEELGYFIYRRGGLYVVMLSSEKDLPEYYGKVVRALLEELTEGKKTRVEL